MSRPNRMFLLILFGILFLNVQGQNTQIRGFAHANVNVSDDSLNPSFFVGEQDLFITSDITNQISFLGESVFKYNTGAGSTYSVGLERLIIKYNYYGNHNVLIGKHHTPFSLWNDKYHHGRVFFPSIERPMLFGSGLLQVHTTGILLQGLNLGRYNVGYQFMVGNGQGSTDVLDDNEYKSLTLDLHAQPVDGMRFGVTAYRDRFSTASNGHHGGQVNDSLKHLETAQMAGGAYFSYFREKLEVLGEAHFVQNNNDSSGLTNNHSAYFYAGYRIKDKFIPYIVADEVSIDEQEVFFSQARKRRYTVGLRYEFSFLANAKLEYRRLQTSSQNINSVNFQIAVGF